MPRIATCLTTVLIGLSLTAALGQAPPAAPAPARNAALAKPQPRPHGQRVPVDPALVRVDDGDTVNIRWKEGDEEIVRILGIDTPETRHLEHNIPYDQAFGTEARAFGQGAFAAATQVELLRAETLDPYGRTLGYLFINGRNYSVLAIRAGLAEESVTHFGDNGLPKQAAEVLAAAKSVGPTPFEPPHFFRRRMGDVSKYMKAEGTYPSH